MTILDMSEYGLLIFFACVAQLVELRLCNPGVVGSSLSAGAIIAALLNTGLNSAAGDLRVIPAAKEGRRIPGD